MTTLTISIHMAPHLEGDMLNQFLAYCEEITRTIVGVNGVEEDGSGTGPGIRDLMFRSTSLRPLLQALAIASDKLPPGTRIAIHV